MVVRHEDVDPALPAASAISAQARRPAVDGHDHGGARRSRRRRSRPATGRGPRRAGSGRTDRPRCRDDAARSSGSPGRSARRHRSRRRPGPARRLARARPIRASEPLRIRQEARIVEAVQRRSRRRRRRPRRSSTPRRGQEAGHALVEAVALRRASRIDGVDGDRREAASGSGARSRHQDATRRFIAAYRCRPAMRASPAAALVRRPRAGSAGRGSRQPGRAGGRPTPARRRGAGPR